MHRRGRIRIRHCSDWMKAAPKRNGSLTQRLRRWRRSVLTVRNWSRWRDSWLIGGASRCSRVIQLSAQHAADRGSPIVTADDVRAAIMNLLSQIEITFAQLFAGKLSEIEFTE